MISLTWRVDHELIQSWSSRSLFLHEADAYFSCPARQMFISYIPRSRCLFFILIKAGAYLSYFGRQMFVCYAPRGRRLPPILREASIYLLCSVKRSFIMSVRWIYVPCSTSHVAHPFPPENVSFPCILYICLYAPQSKPLFISFGCLYLHPLEVE